MKKIISGLLLFVSNICLAAEQELVTLIDGNTFNSPKVHHIDQLLNQHPELDVTHHIDRTKNQMCDDCLQICCGCGSCLYGLLDCCATWHTNEPPRETNCSIGIITAFSVAGAYASLNLFTHGATLGRLNRHANKQKIE